MFEVDRKAQEDFSLGVGGPQESQRLGHSQFSLHSGDSKATSLPFLNSLPSDLRVGQAGVKPCLGMSFRVNLALAYTELTEELGRLRELSSLQGRILRTLLQEQARSGGEMAPRWG